MKKLLLGVLIAVVMLVSLSACGNPQPRTNDANTANIENDQKTSKKFNELTMTRRIGSFDDVWVDLPNWREDGSETSLIIENVNYFIVIAISKEDYTFDELYENEMKSTLKHSVDRGNYEDFIPDSKEDVKLSNGINATKFEGTLSMDNYGTAYKYPTYGYYLEFNNYPIMIMAVETEKGGANKNSEEQRIATNKFVDEIVQTIRSTEN